MTGLKERLALASLMKRGFVTNASIHTLPERRNTNQSESLPFIYGTLKLFVKMFAEQAKH